MHHTEASALLSAARNIEAAADGTSVTIRHAILAGDVEVANRHAECRGLLLILAGRTHGRVENIRNSSRRAA